MEMQNSAWGTGFVTTIIDLAALNSRLHRAKWHNKLLFSKWRFMTNCWFNPSAMPFWTISLGSFHNYKISRWNWCAFLSLFSIVLKGSQNKLKLVLEPDDVIKRKHFPRNWPFMRGIHWSPVNTPHKGHWRGALMFSLICVWINDWVNNREAGDLRHCRAHYDVIVMRG